MRVSVRTLAGLRTTLASELFFLGRTLRDFVDVTVLGGLTTLSINIRSNHNSVYPRIQVMSN